MKHNIYVVGMGPGKESMMTPEAMEILGKSDVIIGYTVYLKLLGSRFQTKSCYRHQCVRSRSAVSCVLKKRGKGKKWH